MQFCIFCICVKEKVMSVVLINRNNKAGFSIYKCFSGFKNHMDIKELFVPEYKISIKNMIANIKYIKQNTQKDDILHITGDIHYVLFGLKKRKTVLTIHDTVLLDRTKRGFKWLIYYFIWFFFPCKIAKQVVCISEETKRRLLGYVKCNAIVIPDPVSDAFKESFKQFNTKCPVILQIGTGWNKNVQNIIKAVSSLNVKLVIIGQLSEEQRTLLLENNINYDNKINLSDGQIIEEYKNCDIVSFATFYEGFGLPILEGQKTGRIVLSSNIEPHKSVMGENAGVLVNPYDVNSIKKGLLLILQDNCLRKEIIEAGFINASKYSESNVVEMYKRIYYNN